MKELFNKILRPTKKWYDFFILGAILSFIMTFVGQLFLTRQTIGEALVDLFTKITGSEGSAQFMYMYSTFIGIWIMFV
ncbi:MAG: hypothetical protein IJJ48_00785, partial [Firmicutes bacterium]|nr:hypothetical protein [Bacillota bacterium]